MVNVFILFAKYIFLNTFCLLTAPLMSNYYPAYHIPQPSRFYLPVEPSVLTPNRAGFGEPSDVFFFDYVYDPAKSGIQGNSVNYGK